MKLLNCYEDFINRVNDLGFMPFSPVIPGLPALTEETRPGQWHTGDEDTDPWCWKDRAASEKKLAYGCVLGGSKGFISPGMYRFFYAVCRPEAGMEERWAEGNVGQAMFRLWNIFEQGVVLDTGEIRKMMNVSRKQGASRIDGALKELQKEFYITVSGNRRKVNKYGEPYSWAANTYQRVTDWAPESWLGDSLKMSREEALEAILDAGIAIGVRQADRQRLAKILRLSHEY